jgi:diguanylate cyclase (GGDEF)-like protein
MFDLPPATVGHEICALDGAEACVYEIDWEERVNRTLPALALALVTAATITPAAIVAPALLPAAIAVPAAGAALLSYLEHSRLRRMTRSLKSQLNEQRDVSGRLTASLRDLVSELRTDELLDKITANAKAALGGKEFALLLKDEANACRATGSIPADLLETLERWAMGAPHVLERPTTIDAFGPGTGLEPLAGHPRVPLGSLCAVPLVFKGESLGALAALAHGPRAFLPHDVTVLESYAAQAAVALSNAHLVDRLAERASQDALTGLLNHREFHEAIEREIARAGREGKPLSVVLLDLDGFKRVNDESGHAEGDKVLRMVAAAIKSACRPSDVACRVGGDEFGVVLPGADAKDAAAVARRIESALGSLELHVEASFGIGQWPADGPGKEMLLLHADMALFAQKPGSGRRRFPHAPTDSAKLASPTGAPARLALHRLARQSCELLGAEQGVVFLRDGSDPEQLIGMAGHGVSAQLLSTRSIAEGLSGQVIKTGEPVVVDDYRSTPARIASSEVSDVRGVVAVPLRWDGTIRGVLSVGTTDPERRFSDADVQLLSELGGVGIVMIENAEMRERLDEALQAGVEAMAVAVDLRDSYTAAHSERVVQLAEAVAHRLDLDPIQLTEVRYAARLHDLGKIGIPDRILHKRSTLTPDEWAVIRQHCIWGEQILCRIPGLESVASIVRSEHERWDGRGYPDGRAGDDIPLASRIIAACDAYHAMTSDRPYRAALSPDVARRELESESGRQFDPQVVEVLLEVMEPAASRDQVRSASG